MVAQEWFGNLSTGLVLLNLAVMCMPYAGMSEEYAARLEDYASVITYLFILEMALKLLGLGLRGYVADRWNLFDGTIVLIDAATSEVDADNEPVLRVDFGARDDQETAVELYSPVRLLRTGSGAYDGRVKFEIVNRTTNSGL